MARLEKSIEAAVNAKVRARGVVNKKMNGLGSRSWPDRMYLYGGRVCFIEFKMQGKKATPLQEMCHKDLGKLGFSVAVVSDVGAGVDFVLRELGVRSAQ